MVVRAVAVVGRRRRGGGVRVLALVLVARACRVLLVVRVRRVGVSGLWSDAQARSLRIRETQRRGSSKRRGRDQVEYVVVDVHVEAVRRRAPRSRSSQRWRRLLLLPRPRRRTQREREERQRGAGAAATTRAAKSRRQLERERERARETQRCCCSGDERQRDRDEPPLRENHHSNNDDSPHCASLCVPTLVGLVPGCRRAHLPVACCLPATAARRRHRLRLHGCVCTSKLVGQASTSRAKAEISLRSG